MFEAFDNFRSKQYLNLLPPRRTPILAFKSHEPSTRTPARPRRPARSRTDIGDALTPLDLEARTFDAALRNAFTLSKRRLAMPPVEMKSLVQDIVERVTLAANRIDIWLNRAKIAAALEVLTLEAAFGAYEQMRRRGGFLPEISIDDLIRALGTLQT